MFLCARSARNLNIDSGNLCTFYTFYPINIQYKCEIAFMQTKMHLSNEFFLGTCRKYYDFVNKTRDGLKTGFTGVLPTWSSGLLMNSACWSSSRLLPAFVQERKETRRSGFFVSLDPKMASVNIPGHLVRPIVDMDVVPESF